MGDQTAELAVVIVNWNTCELLLQCLASLFNQLGSEQYEVVVVDNASQDGSVQAVRRGYPQVRLIANPENRGFAAATNQGVAATAAPLVVLLNPDTVVRDDAMMILMRELTADAQVLAVGPQLLNRDGSLQPSGRRLPGFFRTCLESLLPESVKKGGWWRRQVFGRMDFQEPATVEELSGACFMIRRSLWEQNGPFDEGFFIYFEEVDWFCRLRRLPGSVRYQPSAQVVHHWSASLSQRPGAALRWHYAGLFRFWHKHHGALAAVGMRLAVLMIALVQCLVRILKTLAGAASWRGLAGALRRCGVTVIAAWTFGGMKP